MVIQKINDVCRFYLWSGNVVGGKSAHVNWQNVCKQKKYGELGIRNVQLWNTACVGKLVWHIGCRKDDLWVKWVHIIYIKGANWWTYQVPAWAS